MGAFVISYIVGSIIAIPVLAYHLFRTMRDLNGLRAELRANGVIAPAAVGARSMLGAPRPHTDPPVRRVDDGSTARAE